MTDKSAHFVSAGKVVCTASRSIALAIYCRSMGKALGASMPIRTLSEAVARR